MHGQLKTSVTSVILVFILPALVVLAIYKFHDKVESEPDPVDIILSSEHQSSTDHSTFDELKQEFDTPQEVTEACISCHTGRAHEVIATSHWTWEREAEIPGRGKVTIGKKNLINNFCTGANGNNGSCMRCHIGLGWADDSFDFEDERNVDCLVCHDQTQTYLKQKGQAGLPATQETAVAAYPVPDYNYVAQNVGPPKNFNCGICHFYGGGGNNVKHGDLEEALLSCSYEVDVHMSQDSLGMNCIDCHVTEKHNISGKLYSVSSENKNRLDCNSCHTDAPHGDRILDEHNHKVACQTCHIPEYAKANATKLWWDWSSAGRVDEDGKPFAESDADGNHNYLSIKGNFVWDDHVKPEYSWFNGTADHYLNEDTITEIPVKINTLFGDYQDPQSKIYPVKVHRGKQVYDSVNNTLVHLKLHAKKEGEGGYWKDFDYDTAALLGMKYNNRPYSGYYDFVESEASWPINHMVSPKEQALDCKECHDRNGRLANLDDFYLPGRDYSRIVDNIGLALIILLAIGVVTHGFIRVLSMDRKLIKQNN
ncbi:MAG: tetrathionate reductase family octaheme c-type cytochrome [Cyclobacteriaceae bacterium]